MARLRKEEIAVWRSFITLHAKIIEQVERELLSGKSIPLNWYDVLFALWESPEKKLTPKALTESVILSKSTLTRILDRLEEARLIARRKSETDGRSFEISLTAKGLEAMKKAWPIYSDVVDQAFISKLSASESKRMGELLQSLLRTPQK